MRLCVYAFTAVLTAMVLASSSCRREPKQADIPVPPPSRPAVPPVDPKVTAAVGKMHQAERDWLAKSPEAASAFKRLTEAQAAYQGRIDKFGLYTGPVRDRATRMQELMAAQEKGDAVKTAQAETAFQAANEAVDKAEATLRLGNPLIQVAYDEWLAARKAFEDLRQADETISKASAELMQATTKKNALGEGQNDQVKEIK